jgi:hypothetical protein
VLNLARDGCGFRRQPGPHLPLLFRPRNPARNAAAPARAQIPVIMKA